MPKDFNALKRRAEKGDAEAQNNLGLMYVKGQGVEQDFKEAVKWFQKAADQGFAAAQYNLGRMYYDGKGVERTYVTAYAWWTIAAADGHKAANKGKPLIIKSSTFHSTSTFYNVCDSENS